jgi:hypothetical protein
VNIAELLFMGEKEAELVRLRGLKTKLLAFSMTPPPNGHPGTFAKWRNQLRAILSEETQ